MLSSYPPSIAIDTPDEATDHARLVTRTRAIALGAGRVPPQVSQCDYEQARQELLQEYSTILPDRHT